MQKHYFSIFAAFSLLFLSACMAPSHLQRDHLLMIKKGSSVSEVDIYTKNADLDYSFEFDAEGKTFLARGYDLQTGTQESMSMVCTPTCIAVPIYIPVTAPYVFIFEKQTQQLVSWGLIEELSKDPDESISGLMPPMKTALALEESKSKKKPSKKTNKGN